MTISVNTAWEVRTTGADTNGGGFVAGSSGTDYSQQDAAQISVTDAVANGTTTITSATANFSAAHVGNVLYLAGGTGSLAETRVYVVSVTNGTTIVVDATVAAGTGITLKLGGALLTLAKVAAAMVAQNRVWIRSGTYTITASVTWAVASGAGSQPNRITGYYQTRGDIALSSSGFSNNANRPLVQLSTNTGITAFSLSNSHWLIENISIDCASLGTSRGVVGNINNGNVWNVKVANATSKGIEVQGGQNYSAMYCEVTGCTGALGTQSCLSLGTNYVAAFNWIHNNASPGLGVQTNGVVAFNLITNNTGVSSSGIKNTSNNFSFAAVVNNTVYGNGASGLDRGTDSSFQGFVCRNNIFASNGGYGITGGSAVPAMPWFDGNAYYSNTAGTRNNIDSTSGINAQNAYTNVLDVTCSASPFTDAAGGDFTLNSAAGGGALLRGTATPGVIPGIAQVSYMDFGALQVSAAASGGGARVIGSSIIRGVA